MRPTQAVVVAGALALAGCQQGADQAPPTAPPTETVASPDTSSSGYPPLQSVPPRPQLSYTVQQQRQIVEALVADRENARYTSQVIRYRSGLSSLPPPPAPPPQVAVVLPAVAADEPAVVEPDLTEQQTLIDFLASLRRQIFSDEPEPAAETLPPAAPEALTPASPSSAQANVPAEQLGPAPLPPARGAVVARMAARPHVVDELLDESIAQAPLPSDHTAAVARPEALRQVDATPTAPVPAPRPAATLTVALPSARPLVPAPPPTKPVVPVRSPNAPEPAGDRSAAVLQSGHPWADARASTRKQIIVAKAAS